MEDDQEIDRRTRVSPADFGKYQRKIDGWIENPRLPGGEVGRTEVLPVIEMSEFARASATVTSWCSALPFRSRPRADRLRRNGRDGGGSGRLPPVSVDRLPDLVALLVQAGGHSHGDQSRTVLRVLRRNVRDHGC